MAELERREAEHRQKEQVPEQSEERFRLFYEQSPLGYQSLDADGRILEVNPAWLKILGYERKEVVGRWFGDFLTPDSRRVFPDRFARFKEVGEVHDVRFEMVCGDGRIRCIEFDGRISRTPEGYFDRTHCVLRDVTERKETEEAIRRNEAKYRLFMETTNEGIWAMDADHKTTFVNGRMAAMLGYTEEEMIGRVVEEFMFEEDLPAHRERMAARHDGKAARYEHRFRRKDGGEVWTLVSATALMSSQGRFEGSFAVFTDITDRKRAETRLQQTTKLLRAIRDAQSLYIARAEIREVYNALLQILVTMTDSEFGFLDEVLRDEAGQLYKRSLAISDISWDEDSRKLYRQLAERNFEFRNLNNLAGLPATTDSLVISNTPDQDPRSGGVPKGHPSLRTFMGVPMHFGGRVVGVAGVANRPGGYDTQIAEFLEPFVVTCAGIIQAAQNDAKERQYQQSLRQSHTNLLAIIESTEDLIASRDREGRLIFCNSAFSRMIERLFQVQAKPGLRTLDFLPPAKRQYWQNVFRRVLEGEIFRGEIEYDVDGELRFYDVSFHPIVQDHQIIGTVEFTRDVTEPHRIRKQAQQRQQELLRVSRLSTLGEMASGIAHELNQPLTAILSYGEACRRRIQAESPDFALINEYLEQIISQGQRAGLIIRRMRAMAKGQQTQFISANLQEIIEAAVGMIRWELAQNEIAVCVDIAESLPPAYVDPIQIEQVLLNLIRNSMDAMGAVPPEQRSLTVRATVWDNDYLNVEVCDSGIGLPPPDQGSVFEPFFTTKPDGLGIGLSISRSIIEAHRGTLEARSNPGPGATFFFRLPIYRPTGD